MSKFISLSLICLLILISCPNLFADQVIMTNGERLTGKILEKDGDKIIIEIEAVRLTEKHFSVSRTDGARHSAEKTATNLITSISVKYEKK